MMTARGSCGKRWNSAGSWSWVVRPTAARPRPLTLLSPLSRPRPLCGVSLLCCDFGLGEAKSDARDNTRGEVVLRRPDLAPRNAMLRGEELCMFGRPRENDGTEDCVRVGESGERSDGVRESGATREGDGSRFMNHECG